MTTLWTPEPRFAPHRERYGVQGGDGASAPAWERVDLKELYDGGYDLVEVTDEVVIVSKRPPAYTFAGEGSEEAPDFRQVAVYGESYYSRARMDYNARLRGKEGLRVFDEMRRSNSQIHMALTLRKIPVLAARWYIEPASKSKKDKKIAEFIWNNLTRQLSESWPILLQEALLHIDFGWYAFEEVYEQVDELIRWKRFVPLHPLDSNGWDYDVYGGPDGVLWPTPGYEGGEKLIPINKIVAFTHQKEAGNMEGISALRPMYMHWYFINNLYKIDAIQKEKHGVGIPVIVLPPNFSTTDKLKANEMGRNLRSNEKAHVVLPPMWEVKMLELQGHPLNIIESVDHHNEMIAHAVLAPLSSSVDDQGEADVIADLYMKATRNTAEIIRHGFNKWSIPRLVRWNWGKNAAENPPELRVRRIGETTDWRTISFTLRNLVGANLIRPDKPLLDAMRSEFDLPEVDESTLIQVATPQMPGSAGPPKQSTAGNQQKSPKSNAGTDGSGKAQGN